MRIAQTNNKHEWNCNNNQIGPPQTKNMEAVCRTLNNFFELNRFLSDLCVSNSMGFVFRIHSTVVILCVWLLRKDHIGMYSVCTLSIFFWCQLPNGSFFSFYSSIVVSSIYKYFLTFTTWTHNNVVPTIVVIEHWIALDAFTIYLIQNCAKYENTCFHSKRFSFGARCNKNKFLPQKKNTLW